MSSLNLVHSTYLIEMQLPLATRVASYRDWKRVGRQVRRGEKGATVIVPLVSRAKVSKETVYCPSSFQEIIVSALCQPPVR